MQAADITVAQSVIGTGIHSIQMERVSVIFEQASLGADPEEPLPVLQKTGDTVLQLIPAGKPVFKEDFLFWEKLRPCSRRYKQRDQCDF